MIKTRTSVRSRVEKPDSEMTARVLEGAMRRMPVLERTYQLLSLATSRKTELRAAAAWLLCRDLEVIGVVWCVEHLSRDFDPEVRRAAGAAARARNRRPSDGFARVLARLREDPDPRVRAGIALT
jgi:hypothetical protein